MTDWLRPQFLLVLALSLLRHAAVVLAIAALAFAVGATAGRRVRWGSAAEKVILSTGIGLGLLGHLLFALALLGHFEPAPLALAVGLLALLSLPGIGQLFDLARRAALRRPPLPILAAGGLIAGPLLLLPLYPPTAFDATMYHLPYARAFLATGGAPFLASLRFPVFPQWAEALFALAIFLDGEIAAQGLQTLFTALTAALLFVWGARAFSPAAGVLASALYVGSPLVTSLSGIAYVEPALVFFFVAAFYAFARFRSSGDRRWLAAAGLLAATAASVKYLGLFCVALLLVAVLASRIRAPRRASVVLLAGVLLLFLVPSYARIAAHTGNPVFPYLPEIFGHSAWDLGAHQPRLGGVGAAGATLLRTLRLPWDLVFFRERFGWHPPVSHFYLPGVLLMLIAARRDARALRYGAAAAAYALFVSVAPPDPRYLMPALALAALPIGAGASALLRQAPGARRRALVGGLALLLASPGALYALRHAWHRGPVPLSEQERHRYLARHLPAYQALRHVNDAHPGGYRVYAFYVENMRGSAAGDFWGDWFGPGSYERVLAHGATAEALHRTLRGLGATHLYVPGSAAPPLPRSDPLFPVLFRETYADVHGVVFALELSARSSRTISGSQ